MDHEIIKQGLSQYPENQVNNYIAYLYKLETEKSPKGEPKNPWMKQRKDDFLIRIFKAVADDGLVFDGDDITLQSNGVSYNYQAFKNKMLLAYPETVLDVSLVYESDTFQFSKQSGKVQYTHNIGSPFERDDSAIIGAYCVIKNHRGEFLTLLSKKDIDKHRKVAKTDYIWKSWFAEMAMKTIMKKACKQHFKDVFKTIETMDNENYDLEKLEDDDEQTQEFKALQYTNELDKILDIDKLNAWWKQNGERVKTECGTAMAAKVYTHMTENRKILKDTGNPTEATNDPAN
jgi:hypothetical protein